VEKLLQIIIGQHLLEKKLETSVTTWCKIHAILNHLDIDRTGINNPR